MKTMNLANVVEDINSRTKSDYSLSDCTLRDLRQAFDKHVKADYEVEDMGGNEYVFSFENAVYAEVSCSSWDNSVTVSIREC